ncbi:MAG: hypothetical protein Q4D98_04535 [Planctomycetia bacterium]|nr:hypothetical protein [Planctomycetia bacterium]
MEIAGYWKDLNDLKVHEKSWSLSPNDFDALIRSFELNFQTAFEKDLKGFSTSSEILSFWKSVRDAAMLQVLRENFKDALKVTVGKQLDAILPDELQNVEAMELVQHGNQILEFAQMEGIPLNADFRKFMDLKLAPLDITDQKQLVEQWRTQTKNETLLDILQILEKNVHNRLVSRNTLLASIQENNEGIQNFSRTLAKLAQKFPEQYSVEDFQKALSENETSWQTLFTWNLFLAKAPLSEEQQNRDMTLIPERKSVNSVATISKLGQSEKILLNNLKSFLRSLNAPIWYEYPYCGLNYYLTPESKRRGKFSIIRDNYHDHTDNFYREEVVISDPQLVRKAYHHEFYRSLLAEAEQITEEQITQEPFILYEFIGKCITRIKKDSNLNPPYQLYGLRGILLILSRNMGNNQDFINRIFDVDTLVPMLTEPEIFDTSHFKRYFYFYQKDRDLAKSLVQKVDISKLTVSQMQMYWKNNENLQSSYSWVGFVDSQGKIVVNIPAMSNGDIYIVEKNQLLRIAEVWKGSISTDFLPDYSGQLIFYRTKK